MEGVENGGDGRGIGDGDGGGEGSMPMKGIMVTIMSPSIGRGGE